MNKCCEQLLISLFFDRDRDRDRDCDRDRDLFDHALTRALSFFFAEVRVRPAVVLYCMHGICTVYHQIRGLRRHEDAQHLRGKICCVCLEIKNFSVMLK